MVELQRVAIGEQKKKTECIASLQRMLSTRTGRRTRSCLLRFLIKRDFHQAKFLGGWDEGYIVAEMMFLLLLAILAYMNSTRYSLTIKYQKYPCRIWTLPGFACNKVPGVTRFFTRIFLPGFSCNKGVYIWCQAYVLRLQYLKELENLIEWIVILSASFTIMTKQVMFGYLQQWNKYQINLLPLY